MKKLIFLAILLFAFSTTSALALTLAEVGGFDQFLRSTDQQLNANKEKAWFLEAFSLDSADVVYQKINGNADWTSTTDDGSAIYFDFSTYTTTNPFAFLVKSGSAVNANGAFDFNDGNGNEADTVSAILFENLPNMQFGVVDLDWFTKVNGNFTIAAISHASFASSIVPPVPEPSVLINTPVPEPSTFLLLGAGLAGLGFVARRRRKE